MKIAVSATEPSLDAAIDPRFGRCAYFVIVDAEQGKTETLENTNAGASGGAGIQSAQMIAANGAQVILTGNCGPNAFRTLDAVGIKIVIGAQGTVAEALEKFRAGDLKPADGADVEGHWT